MHASVYTDHRSSYRKDVEVAFAPEGLRFVDELGVIIAFWPYDGLNVVEESQSAGPFRLAHKRFGQTFLTCEDPSILRRLRSLPQLSRPSFIDFSLLFRLVVLVAAGYLCYFLTNQASEYLASPLAQVIPLSWEEGFSKEVSHRVTTTSEVCASPAGVKALDSLVGRLSPAVGLPFEINARVINAPELHTYALSGGELIVFRGLLDGARSPDEFAAILAHELAHTADRHPIAGMIRSLGLSFFARTYLEQAISLRLTSEAMPYRLAGLHYTAEEEATAATLGHMYLQQAAARTDGFETFKRRLQRTNPEAAQKFLSAHGGGGVSALKLASARSSSTTVPLLSVSEWAALQNICAAVIPPEGA